jgi:hypothetical protein
MVRHTFAAVLAALMIAGFVVAARAEDDEAPAWKHDVIVTAPGSKSEGRTGILTYGDQTVLPYFTEVVTPIGHFTYKLRTTRWGDAGWIQHEGDMSHLEKLDEAVTEDELTRGWYSCKFGAMKADTPPSWFWEPSFKTWIDPAKLDAFIKDRFNKADWSYTIKQNDAGVITTTLAYKDTPIPESVGAILTPIGDFYAPLSAQMQTAWLVHSGERLDTVPTGTNDLDEQTIAKGVFDEDPELTDVAIPEHWVYLPDKRWWIDPAKIGEHFKATGGIAPIRTKIGPKGK